MHVKSSTIEVSKIKEKSLTTMHYSFSQMIIWNYLIERVMKGNLFFCLQQLLIQWGKSSFSILIPKFSFRAHFGVSLKVNLENQSDQWG